MAENPFADLVASAEGIKTPKDVFRDQADNLSQASERKVLGVVKVSRSGNGDVRLELNASVPKLGGYTVTLLRVHMKPTSIHAPSSRTGSRVRNAAGPTRRKNWKRHSSICLRPTNLGSW